MDSEKAYYKKIASTFMNSLLLLMGGLALSFSYIQRVEDALENASGRVDFHIGLISAQIYEPGAKHAFFNWGFPVFVVLGIVLIYFSILSKEMAEESTSETKDLEDNTDHLESS